MMWAERSTCLMIDCAVSSCTRARSPWLIDTRPMLLSDCMASRIAGRPTPNRSISLALRRHGVARLEVAFGDEPEQPLEHLVGKFAADNAFSLHGGKGCC